MSQGTVNRVITENSDNTHQNLGDHVVLKGIAKGMEGEENAVWPEMMRGNMFLGKLTELVELQD